MILVIAFCQKDKATTVRLANWIAELGGTSRHDLLLAFHEDTTPDPIHEILKPHFNHVGGFKISDSETTYPAIANIMWHECVKTVADQFNVPWFWMEPDAVPLVPEWLDKIENEYLAAKKPFMLDRVTTPTRSHNSGVGVYPGRVRDYTIRLWELSNIPWDVFLAEEFTPFTHHTALIHDKFYRVWEDPNSGPPIFPDAESLSIIEPGAVLFHRNKDGSLMDRLRESRGGVIAAQPHSSAVGACSSQAPATGLAIRLHTPTEDEKKLMHEIDELKKQRDERMVYWEKREMELLGKIGELSAPQSLYQKQNKAKKQRTPEQIQAAKDRMAKARAGRKK